MGLPLVGLSSACDLLGANCRPVRWNRHANRLQASQGGVRFVGVFAVTLDIQVRKISSPNRFCNSRFRDLLDGIGWINRELLQYSSKDERHRGEYKTHNNHVEAIGPDGESTGIVFETASPFDTPHLMGELVQWANDNLESGELHKLIVIAIFVVVFLAIHPFQDGNGRLSHVLTTLLLLRAGYDYVPYSSLESIIEQNKDSYYLALRRTQVTIRNEDPEWNHWLDFFLDALAQQKVRLQKKIDRERIVLGDLPDLSAKILELTRERGRITVAEATKLTGANRNTIKDHLSALTRAGHLLRHGKGRGTWYGL